jgi:hypothetical protein
VVTPGAAAQLKNLTCTPYGQGEQEMLQLALARAEAQTQVGTANQM